MQIPRFVLLAALISVSAATLTAAQQTPATSLDMSAAEFADAVGGTLESVGGPYITVDSFTPPNRYHATLHETGTGWEEEFIIQVPQGYSSVQKRPVLVFWHAWNTTHNSVVNETSMVSQTTFLDEANQRGWYLIAPMGAHQYHFGIDYAQRNIELLLDVLGNHWLPFAGNFPQFDEERVYGVGFSMGAGAMMAYASQHLDPGHFPYAAVVNHTGTMSVAQAWTKHKQVFDHQLMFGGSPWRHPFEYICASSIHVMPFSNRLQRDNSLVWNVPALPIWTFYADGDTHPNVWLCDLFVSFTQSLGFPHSFLQTGPGVVHKWHTLDFTAACDFLSGHTFTKPQGLIDIIAVGDRRYYDISCAPQVVNELGRFSYDTSRISTNQLDVSLTSNVRSLTIHSADIGLNTAQSITIQLAGTNAGTSSTTLKLTDFTAVPVAVLRNGITSPGGLWSFNGTTLRINEPDPATNPVWTIR